jgi:hypothetical protein
MNYNWFVMDLKKIILTEEVNGFEDSIQIEIAFRRHKCQGSVQFSSCHILDRAILQHFAVTRETGN